MDTMMIVALGIAAAFPWGLFLALLAAVGRKIAKLIDVPTEGTFVDVGFELESRLAGNGLVVDLTRWLVTAAAFVGLAKWDPFNSYSALGIFAALFGLINILSFLIPSAIASWFKNEPRVFSSQVSLRGKQRVFDFALQSAFFCMVVVSIFAGLPITQYREYSYIRQATAATEERDGIVSKTIYPKQVLEIQREGTLWYEIHSYFEDRVYEIQESPDHNRRLKHFTSRGAYDRHDLLQVSWSKSTVATTTGGVNVVNANLPGNVVLTQVASLK